MVPERSAALKGARLVRVRGTWPVGHYAPIVDPRNYKVLKKILLE